MHCFASAVPPVSGLSRRVSRMCALAALLAGAVPSILAQAPQYHPPVVAASNTLAGVTYNYRYEVYGGLAYTHFDAGPSLLQGANLGGVDVQGAYFLTHKWAVDGAVRAYLGTSGVVPNPYGIRGPGVSNYMLLAGPEYRVASNQHASLNLHALFGGTYGLFTGSLQNQIGQNVPPHALGLFNDQIAFGSAIGGSIDLNRSPRLAFRISPDANLTDFLGASNRDFKEQFALSVGLVYRLGPKIDADRPGMPQRPVR